MSRFTQHPKPYLYRLIGWTLCLLLSVAGFLFMCRNGLPIDTNLLDLLPHAKQHPTQTEAIETFSNRIGKQIVLLIGADNAQTAEQAATAFYQTLAKHSVFASVQFSVSTDTQMAWGTFYFPYRFSLLTPDDKQQLKHNQIQPFEQATLAKLYSPIGITSGALLANDPYFTFQSFLFSLPKPATNVTLHDNLTMIHDGQKWYVMMNAHIRSDSFSMRAQAKVIRILDQAKTALHAEFPTITVLEDGMLFYAHDASQQANHEISTIGIGSLFGILLLMLVTFRSLSPLFLTVLSAATGFLSASVICHLIFGKLFLFTLVFGASLIGICVDYAFFYYAQQLFGGTGWQATDGLKTIFTGITLGLLNIVIAFALIAIAPFPAIRQLALFAIVGLSMAYATVVCLFPYILKPKPYETQPSVIRKISREFLKLCQERSPFARGQVLLFLFACFGFAITSLHTNDNIRNLQPLSPVRQAASAQIKQIIGSDIGMDFYVITGDTPEKVLTRSEALTRQLDSFHTTTATPYLAISRYLPSVATQKENFHLLHDTVFQKNLPQYLKTIGIQSPKTIIGKLQHTPFRPLTAEHWLKSDVSASLRFLWIGKVAHQYATVVLLSTELPLARIKQIHLPGVTYVNKADQISDLFGQYRSIMTALLILAGLGFCLMLVLRYGLKKAFFYALVPIGAISFTLGVLALLQMPFTLFTVFALILIFGLSADYVIFFAESNRNQEATLLAILLSTCTTLLSFGLLALSATPVISQFGGSILAGVAMAFGLTPFLAGHFASHFEE